MCENATCTGATANEITVLAELESAVAETLAIAILGAYRRCAEIAEYLGEHRTAGAIWTLLGE